MMKEEQNEGMKGLIDETRQNLYVIKDSVCYNEDGITKCYKCPFGEENNEDLLNNNGWICLIEHLTYGLNAYRYWFMEDEK